MTEKKKDDVTDHGAVELDETELSGAAGGYDLYTAYPSKWKISGFDGKGNDVVTEDVNLTTKTFYPKVE